MFLSHIVLATKFTLAVLWEYETGLFMNQDIFMCNDRRNCSCPCRRRWHKAWGAEHLCVHGCRVSTQNVGEEGGERSLCEQMLPQSGKAY